MWHNICHLIPVTANELTQLKINRLRIPHGVFLKHVEPYIIIPVWQNIIIFPDNRLKTWKSHSLWSTQLPTHSNQKAVFIHPKWCSFEPVSKPNSESISTSCLTTNYEKLFEIITSAIMICALFVAVISFTPLNRNKILPTWVSVGHFSVQSPFRVRRTGLQIFSNKK